MYHLMDNLLNCKDLLPMRMFLAKVKHWQAYRRQEPLRILLLLMQLQMMGWLWM